MFGVVATCFKKQVRKIRHVFIMKHKAVLKRIQYNRNMRELQMFSDRDLRDIGIARGDIRYLKSKY